MILDENLKVKISPITITDTSKGEKVQVDTLVFKNPTPMMAKDTFKMRTYFVKMQKESEKAILGNMSAEAAKEFIALAQQHKETLQAGSPVEALHKDYSDDNEDFRDAKLKKIADMEEAFMQMVDMCVDVNFFDMTTDFGKMILNNKRCFIQCNADGDSDKLEPLTQNVWVDQVDPLDRLKAAVKYCCFFGLTSNTRK